MQVLETWAVSNTLAIDVNTRLACMHKYSLMVLLHELVNHYSHFLSTVFQLYIRVAGLGSYFRVAGLGSYFRVAGLGSYFRVAGLGSYFRVAGLGSCFSVQA